MGVVFFPCLPFMGVMLFPSFRLGNVPGEGGASFALLSLFFIRLLPPLFFLSSSLFFLSFSIFFLSSSLFFLSSFLFSIFLLLFSPIFFLSSFSSLSFLSFSFLSLSLHFVFLLCLLLPSPAFFFFFFCETACTVCFQDVGDDVTNRDPIVIKRDFSFHVYEPSYYAFF